MGSTGEQFTRETGTCDADNLAAVHAVHVGHMYVCMHTYEHTEGIVGVRSSTMHLSTFSPRQARAGGRVGWWVTFQAAAAAAASAPCANQAGRCGSRISRCLIGCCTHTDHGATQQEEREEEEEVWQQKQHDAPGAGASRLREGGPDQQTVVIRQMFQRMMESWCARYLPCSVSPLLGMKHQAQAVCGPHLFL